MKGRATINIATSANPSSQSLGLPQQHVIKKPNRDHVMHMVGRARVTHQAEHDTAPSSCDQTTDVRRGSAR
jgi:hypothetical protein